MENLGTPENESAVPAVNQQMVRQILAVGRLLAEAEQREMYSAQDAAPPQSGAAQPKGPKRVGKNRPV